jgi:hypothetical protein
MGVALFHKKLDDYDVDISVKYLATTQIEFGGN